MDAELRKALGAVARDRTSGAAELALRAVTALRSWLSRNRQPSSAELLEVARALLHVQPSLAPLLRLGNEAALAADDAHPGRAAAARIRAFHNTLKRGAKRIASAFAERLRREDQAVVLTYSYSSTVACALIRARRSIHRVFCSEGRPGGEGFRMAERLAAGGLKVIFTTESGLFSQLRPHQWIVLGADAVLHGWVANKVGTKALVRLALHTTGCTVVFLADTTKFLPERPDAGVRWERTFGREQELWPRAPRNVDVYNLYFELTPMWNHSRVRFVSEKGWWTPRQVRRELGRIVISPRLGTLLD